jgi:glyoxylase-like metal-dependent hydrolase (beta-lactamase superfamily II)
MIAPEARRGCGQRDTTSYLARLASAACACRPRRGGRHAGVGSYEVAAGVRQQLEADAKRVPNVRVLDGRFMVINQAMAILERPAAGARYLAAFVESVKASGFVAKALQANGSRAPRSPARRKITSSRSEFTMIFRQLFDPQSSTYSYLLGDDVTRKAVLIDPVFEQARRDAALIEELGLTLVATLETHVHADHVTGAWLLHRQLGSDMLLSATSGAAGADRLLAHGEHVRFGERHLDVRATPGHTHGCVTYVLDDESMAFTGDCLLIRGSAPARTFSKATHAMYRSVHGEILTASDVPAVSGTRLSWTDRHQRVAEERRFNPRLGGDIGEADFVSYMDNLGLPHPKLIDIAVPANLRCGRPESDVPLQAIPSGRR